MQKITNIIINTALAIVVAFMATGCIYEEMDGRNGMQSVLIQVNVSAEEMTRSMAGVGQNSESAINSIRIYAFYNGALSGHFFRAASSTEPIVMDLLLPESGVHDVDFCVVANEAAMSQLQGTSPLSETTTQEQLKAVSFNGLNSPDVNGLPMYYSRRVGIDVDNVAGKSDLDGHKGDYTLVQVLDVDLVRPLAKVAVFAAESVEGSEVSVTSAPKIKITGVTITNVRPYTTLLPSEKQVNEYAEDIVYNKEIPVVNVIGTQASSAQVDSDKYTEVCSPAYFFENRTGGNVWNAGYIETGTSLDAVSGGAMLVKIEYSVNGAASSAYVKMPAVERNAYYQILCRFAPGGGSQEIFITINEWNYINHTYDDIVVGN